MEIGKYYREFRKDRDISLKDASQGIVSYSFLSKFERGESEITISSLISLIHRLNMSTTEFFAYIDDYDSTKELFLEEINQAYKDQNIAKLEVIIKNNENLYSKTNFTFYKYNSIMTKCILSYISDCYVSNDEKLMISNYLISCSNWTNYEIILLGNSFQLLSSTMQLIIVEEIKKRMLLIDKFSITKYHLINILINMCFSQLRQKETDYVKDLLHFINTQININGYYFKATFTIH
ncbi:MAG: helix-turn-helix domain-containing protein [Aerococcus suis]|nr:helix-turn-helix domain-containing protein [Aerococcus suis]